MTTRRSHYGWMALGGLLCLFGVVLTCKLRDGNRAFARTDFVGPVAEQKADPAPKETAEPPALPALPEPGKLPELELPKVEPAPATPEPPVLQVTGATAPTEPVPPVVMPAAAGTPAGTPLGSDPRPIVIPASATLTTAAAAPPMPPAGGPVPPVLSATGPVPPAPPVLGTAVTPPPPGQPLPPIAAEGTPPVVAPLPPANVTPPAPPAVLPAPPTGTPLVPAVIPPAPPAPPVAPVPPAAVPPPVAPAVTVVPPPQEPKPFKADVPAEAAVAVMPYKVQRGGETIRTLAHRTLGSADRWADIHKLNPTVSPDAALTVGTLVRLPANASIAEESEAVRALPSLRSRTSPRVKVALPLTGTFLASLSDGKVMTLPQSIHEQLGNCTTVLLSPGSDRCLWLTNQAHLDRLQAKLDKSPARESDVRGFKRLYYAQTVKVPVKDGQVILTERLAQFAGLGRELVLVGIDDHFEVWDAAKWRRYTNEKKARDLTEE